jgi:hypothetical protein
VDTVEEHPHSFAASDWPFSEPANRAAFTTIRVLREGYPVLLVSHDQDGDWQFLCGTTNDTAHAAVVCLGCAYERDRSVGPLADLPLGWHARRDSADSAWERFPSEADPDES